MDRENLDPPLRVDGQELARITEPGSDELLSTKTVVAIDDEQAMEEQAEELDAIQFAQFQKDNPDPEWETDEE
jgi:hypothetical protein